MSIYLLSVIYLLPASIILCMAVLIISRNRRSALYRTLGLLFILASLNFFGMFLLNSAPLGDRADLMLYLVFPLLTLLVAVSLQSWYLYVNAYTSKHAGWYKLLFILFLLQLPLNLVDGYSAKQIIVETDGSILFEPGPGILVFWVLTLMVIGVIIMLFIPLFKREPGPAKIFLTAMILSTVWGIITGAAAVLFPSERYLFDRLNIHGFLFTLMGFYINMVKHDHLPSFEKRYNILFERAPP